MFRGVIAIDGPAGAGKSSVAKALAARLELRLLDTGAMYRCVALAASREGLHAGSPIEVLDAIASTIEIEFESGNPQRVLLNGEEVTGAIRTLEIGQLASEISVHPSIRRALVRRQQALLSEGAFVLEGRDVTTVVAPQAELKVFLTASIEERARRRWLESLDQNDGLTLQQVVKDVVERDHRDYTRQDSPLQLAEDARILESFGLSIDQVVAQILTWVAEIDTPRA